jgi:hypothetical protein
LAIEPPEPCPERDRLREIIGCCRKRVNRADAKLRAAGAEQRDAVAALEAAEQRLARWMEANPDPQGSLI